MILILIIGMFLLGVGVPPSTEAKTPKYKVSKYDVQKLSGEMQDTFAGLQYLLNPYQVKQFLSLPNDDERAEWLERFWLLRDPTPTTPENEMRIEHTIRVELARRYFTSKKWPGWDKRGEVFIRYGPPDVRGKIWGEVTVKKMRRPGELWYYRNHNMLVTFEEFGLEGEYIYAIDPLGAWENMSPDLVEYLLYDTDRHLSDKIPQNLLEFYGVSQPDEVFLKLRDPIEEAAYLQSKEPDLPEDIDGLMDPDIVQMLPRDVSAVFQKDQIRETANNFEITLEDVPSSYPFNFNRRELPFYFGVDQFRGGANNNRVDVHLEVPVSVEGGGAFEETYHAEVVVWDSQFEEIARQERDILLRATADVTQWANLLPTQMVFSLERGYYRIAVSIEGENLEQSSSYRTSFSCEPFGPELSVSDILFARKIAPADKASIFTRGALEVIPHPARAYSRAFAVPLYFEIYNLSVDDRGVSSYTIEYRIIPHSNEKKHFWERFADTPPIVASEFQSSGYGEHEIQHILVRTDNLGEGSFDILVTATDVLSGNVAHRKGTFSIVD